MESFNFFILLAGSFGFAAISIVLRVLRRHILDKSNGNFMLSCCTQPTFEEEILIHQPGSRAPFPAVALLDTGCQAGNWISSRLVEELNLSSQVRTDFEPLELLDASGQPVKACGTVDLYWRCLDGTCYNWCRFHVLPKSRDGFNGVILGADFIRAKNLLSMNRHSILTLMKHKKITKKEKEEMEAAEKERERMKAEREARRNNQHGNQGSGGGAGGAQTT